MLKINIKYHDDLYNNEIQRLEYIDGKSDWIDLRSVENVNMNAGDYELISLGISIELPNLHEAIIVPRSSTYKNFGIIQANSIGIIDNSYCGNNDIWKFPAIALRDTTIHKGDRICQFRIIRNQPELKFEEVDFLEGKDRDGFGSTGIR